jgi:hypothetical protein
MIILQIQIANPSGSELWHPALLSGGCYHPPSLSNYQPPQIGQSHIFVVNFLEIKSGTGIFVILRVFYF